MSALVNILDYAHELVAIGVSEEEANIHARKLAFIIDNTVASKEDLKSFREEMKKDMGVMNKSIEEIRKNMTNFTSKEDLKITHEEIKSEIRRLDLKIEGLESRLEARISAVESKLNWLISLAGFATALVTFVTCIKPFLA